MRRAFALATVLFACLGTFAADSPPATRVIADFENGSRAPFQNGTFTSENVPQGKGAIRIESGYIVMQQPQDWTGYDYLRFDTFNPSDRPVTARIEIRDRETTGYWTRVNQPTVIPPGKGTSTFRTDLYVGEKSRPGRPLLRDKITHFVIAVEQGPVVIDNIRLERLDVPRFEGLLAFDFGTPESPVMEGYTQSTIKDVYSPEKKYGWVNTDFWRAFDTLQPDALTQDFVVPRKGTFRADLPNGRYHVVMNLESPGGFWGEVQIYTSRKVTANGKTVVEDSPDYDRFVGRYFRNAHQEDLPGVDTFKQYVTPMFEFREFDVDITAGKLELAFTGDRWANCLSVLVIYPAAKTEAGSQFLSWTHERRRTQFQEYFKQVEPKRATTNAEGQYALFTRHPNLTVNAYDGPASPEEAIGENGLSLAVAQGEEAPLNFAVQPGASLGKLDVEVSEFRDLAGHILPAGSIRPGWLEYRITRIQADGSVYSVSPRYWKPAPAPDAPGVTRRFWMRVNAPASTPPGEYRGRLVFKPQNAQPRVIPVSLRVLPFSLDEISDVAVGPWGSSIDLPWEADDQRTNAWNWAMFEKSLDAMREAGCTSFAGRPTLRVAARDGKITLDSSLADREMELIRSKGFKQLISSYGSHSSLGYQLYGDSSGPDLAAARKAGFADMGAFLRSLYDAIEAHAAEKNWLPVAWNLCDEPLEGAIPGAVANAKAHRAALETAGWKYSTFMGATSLTGNKSGDPHVELVRALPMPSLNLHDEQSLELLRSAGGRFSFYNGGNRWTFGRYMKALRNKHDLALRLTWHFNIVAGNPYYALDCREDDYCWFNTDEKGTMVPSVNFLDDILPGLNDYRYLCTLERLVRERKDHPAAAEGKRVLEEVLQLRAGVDRPSPGHASFDRDREAVTKAIVSLITP